MKEVKGRREGCELGLGRVLKRVLYEGEEEMRMRIG